MSRGNSKQIFKIGILKIILFYIENYNINVWWNFQVFVVICFGLKQNIKIC